MQPGWIDGRSCRNPRVAGATQNPDRAADRGRSAQISVVGHIIRRSAGPRKQNVCVCRQCGRPHRPPSFNRLSSALAEFYRDVVRVSRWRNTHARVHPPMRGVTVKYIRHRRVLATVVLLAAAGVVIGVVSRTPPPAKSVAADASPQDSPRSPKPDLSGHRRTGKASFYAK